MFNGYKLFLSGRWSTTDFIIAYITLPIFVATFVFWKLFKKTRFVKLHEIDLDTGRRELDEMSEKEAANASEPTTWYGKLWAAIM